MTSDEITTLHAEMMKAYRSDIYWIRRNPGYRDHETRAYITEKRALAAEKYRALKDAYYTAIRQEA